MKRGCHARPVGAVVACGLLCLLAPRARADLYIDGQDPTTRAATLYQFNETTGAFIRQTTLDPANHTPEGLAPGPDGRIYAAIAFGTDRVDRRNPDGTAPAGGATFVAEGQGGVRTPVSVAFGPDGNLYVAGSNSGSIDRYYGPLSTTGTPGANDPRAGQDPGSSALFALVSSPNAGSPTAVAFAPNGTLFTEGNNGTIYTVDGTGSLTPIYTGGGSNPSVSLTTGIAVNGDGTKLFVDVSNNIYRFSISGSGSGTTLTYDSGFGLSFTQGTGLNSSQGIAFGPDGNLYVTDAHQNSVTPSSFDYVEKIDPTSGVVSPFIQAGPNAYRPNGITFFDAPTDTPEPSSLALGGLVAAVGGFAAWRRRRAGG